MAHYGFTINVNGNSVEEMKKIEAAISQLGIHATTEAHKIAGNFEEMGSKIGEAVVHLKSLFLTGLGLSALFEGWEFIEKSKEAFENLEKAIHRVDTVLKSTHYAAGFTSLDIQDQAKELSSGITNKRDEILDAQGMMLSFHDVKGAKFTETMKSVADFATFYKEDMTQAAMQVGKAVNNPLVGMTRLQRMGVEFSQTQKDAIKNYITQGNLLGAQEVILKELRTEFGGQAKAFALTDAGKIQIAYKQWEELQFALGEIISRVEVSLIPAFSKLVAGIKYAFNSSVIQFFIEHLKDLVELVLKLVPIWATYKVIMLGAEYATKAFAYTNVLLGGALRETAVTAEMSKVAFEGLESAIVSTGIGALVVGIGLVIEKLISMNSELDESVDKITNLSKTQGVAREDAEVYRDISKRMGIKNSLGVMAQSELLTDAVNAKQKISENIEKTLNPSLMATKRALDELSKVKFLKPTYPGEDMSAAYGELGMKRDKLRATLEEQTSQSKFATAQLKNLGDYVQTLKKTKGVHLLDGAKTGGSMGSSATNISQLSGANGGLGQAKVINIHIDTIQKIGTVTGDNLKQAAQKAVEQIIRTVNNLAYSQSSL